MDNSIKSFYKIYPYFDYNFYISNYIDLQNANINTEIKAIQHYLKYGLNEKRLTHKIIYENNNYIINNDMYYINFDNYLLNNQCYVSSGLYMFKTRLFNKYNLIEYNDINKTAIFFGLYTNNDLIILNNHKGLKIIIWGGEDANYKNLHSLSVINQVKILLNTIHLSISKCIQDSLYKCNITSILIDFNLVDKTLFYPLGLGNKIFIYNGSTTNREHIYGCNFYEEIQKLLPQYEYIKSNTLNIQYNEMPNIYKQCFIALRLTEHDGNANMVQECQEMKIPVIHNFSNYGLKWKNINDIIKYILDNDINIKN